MTEEERRSRALAAAQAATEAANELIRYAREGADWPTPFGNCEVEEKLADALKMAFEIREAEEGPELDDDQGQLLAACVKYLEGWAG